MYSWIEYLNDPNLVLQIQKYFGVVKSKDYKFLINKSSKIPDKQLCAENGSLSDNVVKKNLRPVNIKGSLSERESYLDETLLIESDVDSPKYIITKKFWYYLFVFGTELGDELFYATFIPFWFWNVDGAVGRRVVMVWSILMYVGQGIKDIVCWPRPPSPPVFRLQKKWSLEYGMPSTHAMVGVSIPFSVVFFTMARYQYPVVIGFAIATAWCIIVSISRLYLGMHSVLDVLCGLLLAISLMVPLIPLVDYLDNCILTSYWSPVFLLGITTSLIIFYPKYSEKWTPTRGDTAVVLSVCAGVHIGAWTNYHLGQMSAPLEPPPYVIIWPSYNMIGLSLLRCAIGFSCIIATRAICKSASYATICFFLKLNIDEVKKSSNDAHRRPHSDVQNTIELIYKYITYVILGFNILYMLPTVFKLLRIDRPTFYTEI